MLEQERYISVEICTLNFISEALAACYLFCKNTTKKVASFVYIVDCFDLNLINDLNYKARKLVENITFCSAAELYKNSLLAEYILTKYSPKNGYDSSGFSDYDFVRWGLKPSTIIANLSQNSKIIYFDTDIVFLSNFDFLWSKLETTGVLLTPHYSDPDPFGDASGLSQLLRDGLFNAGFIGASNLGIEAIRFWERLCAYKIANERSFFVDQKYLDLLPIYYSKEVSILNNKGCNVAPWNVKINDPRILSGKCIVSSDEPIVFFHNSSRFLAEEKLKRRYPALSVIFNTWNSAITLSKECFNER